MTVEMGMQPILLVTVTVKKIKGPAHKCCGDGGGVVRCERPSNPHVTIEFSTNR